ncbi:MAG: pyridoxamine 5'-phosphate oxidase family protein [Bacilli bacterium]|nr:pyridoxamine 5'-phosphate oxidase family protein [Bacilli bacterium]
MFPQMRRIKNQMEQAKAVDILTNSEMGVLGTISDNGYPYTVPVNYVYINHKIYFHSAFTGHKISNIQQNNKVSFTVVSSSHIVEEEFTTKYESVIVFGRAKIIDPNQDILFALIEKYSPHFLDSGKQYVKKEFSTASIVEIEIDYMSGKERI